MSIIQNILARGNAAYRDNNYEYAVKLYSDAKSAMPELEHIIDFNIQSIRRNTYKNNNYSKNEIFKIDIIIPVYNAIEDVKECLESVKKYNDEFNIRIIIVNDCSDRYTSGFLNKFCDNTSNAIIITHKTNCGYTKSINSGLKISNAPYVVCLNSDTIVTKGWLIGLLQCMHSDPKIGIVGPLSNAATWQNVPNLWDDEKKFAINNLPAGLSVEDMAQVVASAAHRTYPYLPIINGFCFMTRRSVIDIIGYMDEENFSIGYGEEVDFCIRANAAGFKAAVADDTFVFHAKSKSFGHKRRKHLTAQGQRSLQIKYGSQYTILYSACRETEALDAVRERIQHALGRQKSSVSPLMNLRILFLLPVSGGGGGAHSVVQEAMGMRRMGVHASVAVRKKHIQSFQKMYCDTLNSKNLFVAFDESTLLYDVKKYDVVIATIFKSVKLVKKIVDAYPNILPAYYIQDYEPLFFAKDSPEWSEAYDSYSMIPDALLFAKTQWLVDKVMRDHNVVVHKVTPSIDHSVYKPRPHIDDGCLHVTAMVRPQTPRRGAERTMCLLQKLYNSYADRIAIHIFGCDNTNPDFLKLERSFPFQNHGPLFRPQVAELLAQSDIFIDLSDYQAFGRTALEAAACGCAIVVPKDGGSNEYAVQGKNAVIVDTQDETLCFKAVSNLLNNPDRILYIRKEALLTASKYSIHSSSMSEFLIIENAFRCLSKRERERERERVKLMPSISNSGKYTGSAFVRILLPFQQPSILKAYDVSLTNSLPEHNNAEIVVIQREAIGHSLADLKEWLPLWKAKGGKIVYELDDDLLDGEGLKARGYKGDIGEIISKVRLLATEADMIHVSTQNLGKRIRSINSAVRVIPNALDTQLWQLEQVRPDSSGSSRVISDGPVRIGYIGTPTHDDDMDLISTAMKIIEEKYSDNIHIEIIGAFEKRKALFGKRVGLLKDNEYSSFVPWLQQIVHWDIGIIPLVDNQFNKSKSYIKFLEYAALNMAIVVSDVPAYRLVAKHGVNCLLAKPSAGDWVEKLSLLIEDKNLRQQLAKNARDDVIAGHTLRQTSQLIVRSLADLAMR